MKKFALAVALLTIAIFESPLAFAHSNIVSTYPKNGAILSNVPRTIKMSFHERLLVVSGKNPNTVTVVTANGSVLPYSTTKVSKNQLMVSLKEDSNIRGRLKVAYRVVSADGHVITGSFYFTVK